MTWRLNNTFLNNKQVTGEIKGEIIKYLETTDDENMMQSLWSARAHSSTVLPPKDENHHIDNLTLYIRQLGKGGKNKPKVSRRK